MQQLGIENVKTLASVAAKMGTAAGKVLEDGVVDWRDTFQLPAFLGALKDVSKVDFKALVPEVKDLDEAEKADLSAHFQKTFDWPDDAVEGVVEQGLEIVLAALEAVLSFVRVSTLTAAKKVA